jgi:hypothetical protein
VCGLIPTAGSNPALSASIQPQVIDSLGVFCFSMSSVCHSVCREGFAFFRFFRRRCSVRPAHAFCQATKPRCSPLGWWWLVVHAIRENPSDDGCWAHQATLPRATKKGQFRNVDGQAEGALHHCNRASGFGAMPVTALSIADCPLRADWTPNPCRESLASTQLKSQGPHDLVRQLRWPMSVASQ